MAKQFKNESSSLGVKIFSAALLIQQGAAAAPAFGHGHHGQGHGRDGRIANFRQGGGGWQNAKDHFGAARQFERPLRQELPLGELTRAGHLPRLAGSGLPLSRNDVTRRLRLNDVRLNSIPAIDLDLSSSVGSITIDSGMIRRGSSVSIQVGESTKIIREGDTVTAAEFVSLQQAQTNRGQSLEVDQSGRASGGTFSLSALSADKLNLSIGDVVIPQSVQSNDRVSARSQIDITGNLINYGTLNETVKGKTGSANFSAHDIINHSGGLITTTSRPNSTVDLSLHAAGDFENAGEILSSGAIDIKAGGSIKNTSTGGDNLPEGVIRAANNVSLHSANVINSGSIGSASGNVSFDAPSTAITTNSNSGVGSQTLTIDNAGGTISALVGDISIRQANYNGTSDSNINGGDLLSQRLMLNSGQGMIGVDVNKLTGEVVSSGTGVHVHANTDNLTIGKSCLIGDPTFYNSLGNISITGDLIVGEALAIIARGNITADNTVSEIRARNGGGQGFNINIIAGANVSGSLIDETSTIPGVQASGNVSFSGASGTGGNVDFSAASSTLQINSNSTTGNLAGGNINLMAYSNGSAGGRVLLPTSSNIDASGNGSGAHGNLQVVAGDALFENAIILGSISHGGTTAGATSALIAADQPVILGLNPSIVFNAAGVVVNGNTLGGAFGNQPGSISISGTIITTNNVLIQGGGALSFIGGASSSGVFTIRVSDNIVLGNNLTAPGGILLLSGHNIVSSTPIALDTSSSVGNGGALTVIAGAAFINNGVSSLVFDPSTSGGQIDFRTQAVTAITTKSSFAGGAGGTINMGAFEASGSGGDIKLPSALVVTTDGTGALGANGEVRIVAGKSSGTAIQIGGITTTVDPLPAQGDITLIAAAPVAAPLNPLSVSTNGSIVGGIQGGTLQAGNILTGNLNAFSRLVSVATAGNVVLGAISVIDPASTTGNAGTVSIQTQSGTPLTLGSVTANSIASIDIHGGSTFGNPGTISIAANGGIVVGFGSIDKNVTVGNGADITLDAFNSSISLGSNSFDVNASAINGNGGHLSLRAQTINSFLPSTFSADGPTGGTGSGGFIELEFTGSFAPEAVDPGTFLLNARSGTLGGNGGSVSITASLVQLAVGGSAINVNSVSPLGSGGQISITAASIVPSGAGPLQLTSNGTGGSGGTILLHQLNGGPLVIGNGNGQIQLTAVGAGSGGVISVVTNGDLRVNVSGINAAAANNGNGATLTFQSGETGTGNLLVVGNLSVSGSGTGTGGAIALISNSAVDFNIGSKKAVNGVNGILSAFGNTDGNLTVTNNSGSIVSSTDLTDFGQINFTATGGSITLGGATGQGATAAVLLTADGSISSKKLISGNTITLTSVNGSIGGKKALKISADALSLAGETAVKVSNDRGALNVLSAISDTSSVSITSAGSIEFSGNVGGTDVELLSSGTNSIFQVDALVSIVAANTLTVDTGNGVGSLVFAANSGSLEAPTMDLSAGSGTIGSVANPVRVNTTALAVSASQDVVIAGITNGAINLNAADTVGNFELDNIGAINVFPSFKSTGTVTLTTSLPSAGINLNSSIGGKDTTLILMSTSDGNITPVSSKIKLTGTAISFATGFGAIGQPGIPLTTVSAGVSVLNSGSVNLASALKKATAGFAIQSSGDINVTSAGPTTLASFSGKSIFVQNSGGLLLVNNSMTVQALDGGIVLNNLGKGKGSMIELGANSQLISDAFSPDQGEIDVVIGALPPAEANTANPNVNVTLNGTGQVFFNEGITANGAASTVIATNTKVIFSAGKFGPTAIQLDSNVTIDADPPAAAAALSAPAYIAGDSRDSNRGHDNRRNQPFNFDTAAGIDLDLSSSTGSILIQSGMIERGSSIDIQVGGSTKTIHEGDTVTAAEFVSLQQAQTKDGQALDVDQSGRATGGSFSLGSLTSRLGVHVDDLVIPRGVQSIDRVSSKSQISISGNLTNFGTIDETLRGRSGAVSLSARDIVNQSGGLITTNSRGGRSIDLNLRASNDFENVGVISSSGSLDIKAGGSLKNTPGHLDRAEGLIMAVDDVSLHSANVVNLGFISSADGNIRIDAPSTSAGTTNTAAGATSQTLSVNNTGGTLSALTGDISIRQADYNGTASSTVTGGNLLSQRLLLNAGQGSIDVNVNDLTGEVVSSGTAVHVMAHTDNLILGTQKLDGDPTFYNPAGNITINGDVTVSEALAIVSSGSIIATAGLTSITARDGGGDGYDISIIAGVNVTGVGGDTTSTLPAGTQAAGNVTFTGVSGTGGDVDLSLADSLLAINSNATAGSNSGGNVLIAAYANGVAGGRVLLPVGGSINVAGNGPGADGNVTVIGSSPVAGPNSVILGTINGASNVTVMQATPVFTSGSSMTFNTVGAITSGNTLTGNFSQLKAGSILIAGAISANNNVLIAGGGTVSFGDSVGDTINANRVTMLSQSGDINIVGSITSPGGMLLLAGLDIVSTGGSLVTSSSGNAGDMTIIAGASFTADALNATVTGASATGGTVDFDLIGDLRAAILTADTDGGDITIAAFAGTVGGDVLLGIASEIDTSGNGTGVNGNVSIAAGKTTPGTAITVADIQTGDGDGGGGDIILAAATPNVTVGNTLVVSVNGTVQSGNIQNSGLLQATDIIADELESEHGLISVSTGRNVDIALIKASTNNNDAGSVIVRTGGSTPLSLNPSVVTANEIDRIEADATGLAGSVFISSDGGIILAVGGISQLGSDGFDLTLDAHNQMLQLPSNTLNADGGALVIRASDIDYSGEGLGPLFLSSEANGDGGSVSLTLTGPMPFVNIASVPSGYVFDVTGTPSSGTGGSVAVTVSNSTTLVANGLAINVSGTATGTGGSISLTGGKIQTLAGQSMDLNTGAGPSANGGAISIHQTNGDPLVIGQGAGQLNLNASSGAITGDGGSLTVITNADLTVDVAGFRNTASGNGNGGTIFLQAGETSPGNLLVVGSLNADGFGTGDGGVINLRSNSAVAFEVGTKKSVNGNIGTLSVLGGINGGVNGNLGVFNDGGGAITSIDLLALNNITIGVVGGVALNKAVGSATTGSVEVTAGSGAAITSKKVITASDVTLIHQGAGTVGGKKALKINADSVDVNAAGAVNIQNTRLGALVVNDSSSTNSTFKLTTAGSLFFAGDINALTSATLSSTGTNAIVSFGAGSTVIVTSPTGVITVSASKGSSSLENDNFALGLQANSVVLSAGSGTVGSLFNDFFVSTQNLSVSAGGDIKIDDFNSPGTLNLNSVTTSGSFELQTDGALVVNTTLKSATAIDLENPGSGGGILLNQSIGSTKSTTDISITAAVDITQATTKLKINARDQINLVSDSGNVGATGAALTVDAATIFFDNHLGAGNVSVNSIRKGTVVFQGDGGGDVVLTSAGATDMSALKGKSISITNGGGLLSLQPGGTIETTDGGILLNNIGKGKGSMILLGQTSTLKSFATAPGGGEIDIVMGTLLPPPQVVGTTPTNVSVVGTGTVFFNEGITANGPTNNILLKNTNVNFSAGGFGPGSIVLDGGVTIDADPPLPAPLTAPLPDSTARGSRHAKQGFLFPSLVQEDTVANQLDIASVFEPAVFSNERLQDLNTVASQILSKSVGSNGARLSDDDKLDSNAIGLITLQSAGCVSSLSMFGDETDNGYGSDWISETELNTGEIPASLEIVDSQNCSRRLNRGTLLVAPMTDTSIQTPFGDVQIAANSLALVMSFKDGVAVFNFDDSSKHSVSFSSSGSRVSIAPSQSLIVSRNSTRALSEINPAQLISHRSVRERPLGSDMKAFHTEFSIPSALNAVLPMRELMKSKHPHAVKTVRHFMKTTSIMMQLQAGGDDFRQHRKPQMTAYRH